MSSACFGPDEASALAKLEAELPNFRAALAWLGRKGDIAAGLEMGMALGPLWDASPYVSEGRAWLEHFLDATKDRSEADPRRKRLRAKALAWSAHLALEQNDHRRGSALATEYLRLAREFRNKPQIGHALTMLGTAARVEGDFERAATHLEEALALSVQLGDTAAIAANLSRMGTLAREQGDYRRAIAAHQMALTSFRERGRPSNVAIGLMNLAIAHYYAGETAQSSVLLEEANTVARSLGDRSLTAAIQICIAELALDTNDYVRAVQLYRESLQVVVEAGDRLSVLEAFAGLASAALVFGLVEPATRLLGATKALGEAWKIRVPRPGWRRFEDDLAAARARLGERFEEVWASGRALTLELAISEATQAALRLERMAAADPSANHHGSGASMGRQVTEPRTNSRPEPNRG